MICPARAGTPAGRGQRPATRSGQRQSAAASVSRIPVAQELDQQAHAKAGASPLQIGREFGRGWPLLKGHPGDVQVCPGITLSELLEEHGRSADTSEPVSGVGQVGGQALQAGQILIVERHMPDALPAGLAGGLQAAQQTLVGAKGAGSHAPPQGHDTRPGQSSQVDHRLGFKAGGIGQGVGQDQASFGVGVDNLDCLAVHGRDHIAGLVGMSTG